jgi:uracil-DNA glycosylase
MSEIKIDETWKQRLQGEFEKDYMKELRSFLKSQLQSGKEVYPQGNEIFQAFNSTPFDKTKVVIIGQDPYHGPGQAHGLCFSVKPGVKTPPSLVNIYKELNSDLGIPIAKHGNLINWANQGVLMLNNVLTVERSKAGSHRKKGWEQYTDKVIEVLNEQKEGLVFILWGRDAQTKAQRVDRQKHYVLESAHPSPFSAHRFFGGKHFSKANDYLISRGLEPINWNPDLQG